LRLSVSTSNQFPNESLLIEQCLSNNRIAQKHLYDKYAAKMFAVCLRYEPESEMAKDLLQEGFIKIFRHLESFRGEGSFEGWMRRIFVTTCIGHLQRKKHLIDIDDSPNGGPEDKEMSGFEKLSLKDLHEMIQSLSDGYRTVFNLYAVEGFSHKEISEILHITVGTSKSQYARAKIALQRTLEKNMSKVS
jgi:RNA polymerase sigma factor (sigma-70 family)